MRRLLIVAPHFSPTNAPDGHRARLALPHLRKLGWDPTVLAIHPDYVEGAPVDPLLAQTYPASIPVIRTQGLLPRTTRQFGFGGLWLRCGRPLAQAGSALLRQDKFDLIFISTSQVDAFNLGPRWRRQFGVPYVLDFQDPWVNDYYREHKVRPPGGTLKYWWAQRRAQRDEPTAVRQAAAIVSVSSSYGPNLMKRYPDLQADRLHHLPFGAAEIDLDIARSTRPSSPLIPFGDGNIHHVYAGRCPPNMRPALDLLFDALQRFRRTEPSRALRHRFHFIGTDYAPDGLAHFNVLPSAQKAGVADQVAEHPARIPYFDALHYIARADSLIILGSSDADYNASKMYPYLLAERPLIVIAHQQSQMLALARNLGITHAYGFDTRSAGTTQALTTTIHDQWFVGNGCQTPTVLKLPSSSLLTAEKMTHVLANIFTQAVSD